MVAGCALTPGYGTIRLSVCGTPTDHSATDFILCYSILCCSTLRRITTRFVEPCVGSHATASRLCQLYHRQPNYAEMRDLCRAQGPYFVPCAGSLAYGSVERFAQRRQPAGDRGIDQAIADANPQTTHQRGVDMEGEDQPLAKLL